MAALQALFVECVAEWDRVGSVDGAVAADVLKSIQGDRQRIEILVREEVFNEAGLLSQLSAPGHDQLGMLVTAIPHAVGAVQSQLGDTFAILALADGVL